MLNGKGMVRAWSLEQFLKVVRSALHRLPTTPTVCDGHERALALLLALLLNGMIGGVFAGILVLSRLTFEVIKDCSNYFFARGMAGGDV